jgi:hypothetical protein
LPEEGCVLWAEMALGACALVALAAAV